MKKVQKLEAHSVIKELKARGIQSLAEINDELESHNKLKTIEEFYMCINPDLFDEFMTDLLKSEDSSTYILIVQLAHPN